jgi:formyl-CoA transferase
MEIETELCREMFLRLVERSDGLIENNAPGLLDKFGVGPDVLHARNPGLIIVRMLPLGLWGPTTTFRASAGTSRNSAGS